MGLTLWTHRLALVTTLGVAAVPAFAQPAQFPPGPRADRDWRVTAARETYDRGYREGLRNGERDARANRPFDYERNDVYRSATRGSNRDAIDSRSDFREFQQGFSAGYRVGYQNVRQGGWNDRGRNGADRPGRRGYEEPAFARGYADGYEQGTDDGQDRDRYDAVGHKDYREGDEGYFKEYGPKEAYRNNYRSGFREGYEAGYRAGQWRR